MSGVASPLSAERFTLASRLPVVLAHPVVTGSITLKFTHGRLQTDGNRTPHDLLTLASALRDTFGDPVDAEELCMNFSGGILASLERRARRHGVETREFFRVRSEEPPRRRSAMGGA